MKTMIRNLVTTCLMILILTVVTIAQTDYSSLKDEFRKEIQKKMKQNKVKGASIALVQGDSIIWSEGFGFADVENKIKATSETQYRIGSVTKLFTGTAVMQLNEKNLINIDEPVNKLFPEFNIKSRFGSIDEITPRNVMTHTAGLPCDIMRGFVSENPESHMKEIEYLNKEYTIYKPNEVFAYSNPGFNLLGCMVEDVSNTPYKEYIGNNIFDKWGMDNSYFNETDATNLAVAYNGKGKLIQEIPIREVPAGEIKSTVIDLSKFISSHLPSKESPILTTESYNEMRKTQFDKLYEGPFSKIGLTWFIREMEGFDNIYEHGGATLYHRAKVAICPEQNIGIAILTNSSRGGAITSMSTKILKKVIALGAEDVNKTEEENVVKEKTENKKSYKKGYISPEDLNKLNGAYALPDAIYEIRTNKNKLTAKIQGYRMDMFYVGNNEFLPVLKLMNFIPIKMKTARFIFKDEEGEKIIYQKDVESNGLSIVVQRFDKPEITEKWEQRVGKYKIVNNRSGDHNLFDKMEITKENDILILKATVTLDGEQEMEFGLGIISNDLAYVLGKGRQGGYSVAVEYDDEGNELLRFTGFLLKKE